MNRFCLNVFFRSFAVSDTKNFRSVGQKQILENSSRGSKPLKSLQLAYFHWLK